MRTIKVMLDGFGGAPDFDREGCQILELLRKHYNVELTDDPDYIFYDVGGKEYYKHDCVRIFFTIEAICPDFNLADYGIGYEEIQFGDRYFRCPNYVFYKEAVDRMAQKHENVSAEDARRSFCSFTYSNLDADSMRRKLYKKLSAYKPIDAGGKLFHNVEIPNNDKFAFDRRHKFSIACENSEYPGYHTEKLVEAFAAGTIPIYWGDPHVGEYFNEKAFINCNAYTSVEDVRKQVEYLDTHDDAYLEMLHEPALSCEMRERMGDIDASKWYLAQLEAYLVHIIDQPYELAFRRNRGFWGRVYGISFFKERELLRKWDTLKDNKFAREFSRIKIYFKDKKNGHSEYHPKE